MDAKVALLTLRKAEGGLTYERFRSISLELGLSPTVTSQGGSTSLWDDHVEVRRWYVICSAHYDLRSPL